MDKKKWIIPYLQQFRGLFALSILLGTMTVLFSGALMFTSGYLITKASTHPESILMVYVPIVGVRTFGIGRAVLSYVQRLTGHQMVLKILSEMRVRLYNLLEPQALFLRSRFLTGDLLGVLADDIEHLQDFYLKTLFPSLVSLVTYALIVVSTGVFSVSFAVLLAFLIGILLFLAPFLSLLYLRVKNKQLKKGRNLLYQQFTDAILGISDWIFSGSHRGFIEKYEKNEEQLLQIEKSQHRFINWRDVVNQGILGLIVVFSVYWSSQQASSGVFEPTFIAAVSLAMLSLLESFLPLSSAVSDTSSYRDSIFRLNQLQGNETHPVESGKESAFVPSVSQPLNLDINSISYQYQNGPSLLDAINLNIGPQEKVAIIGRSGTGKSTLLKLIQGALSPTAGEILLNHVNVKEMVPAIPKFMSVLNQKPYLFNTSVLNNIRLGDPNASDEEVYEAAKRVQLHEMIIKLPNGYDTNMHETGDRFSGGERQRIALARVLLQKTPIVIMDEPTVGLDPLTEKKLLDDIFDILNGKMIIWVTHHLAGVEKMDRILFLDEGKIVMEGNHKELLITQDRYRRLYQLDRPFDLDTKNRQH